MPDINLAVVPEEQGLRLDQFLVQKLPHLSRSRLQKWIKSGAVHVNEHAQGANYRVRPGDRLTVTVPVVSPSYLAAEPIELAVIYEDDDILVLNKPPGLTVHPGAGCQQGTLVHALLYHCPRLQGIGDVQRPGLVHRLDKETSGVMVVAKTELAHQGLLRQFHDRQVDKIYLALVWGLLVERAGMMDQPIGRHPQQRQKMSVQARHSRAACTEWRRRQTWGGSCSFLEIRLHTGRTHQIRVHMAAAGHPVVGDKVYGGGARRLEHAPAAFAPLQHLVTRHLLHAWTLSFTHPASGVRMTWQAPLATDFQAVLDFLAEIA